MPHTSAATGMWFPPQAIQYEVDPATWDRGHGMFLQNRVLSMEVDFDGVGWVITGEVQGTQRQPYHTEVEITLDPKGRLVDWYGDCTCPVGMNCKHAVALSIKAAYQGRRLVAVPHKQPTDVMLEAIEQAQARLAQQAEAAAERQLLAWLNQVEAAQDPHEARLQGLMSNRRSGKAAPRPESFLYLVAATHTQGLPRLQMSLVTASTKVNGQWAKPRAVNHEPQSTHGAYKSASAADHEVRRLMRANKSARDGYTYGFVDTVLPTGEAGAMMLRLAASTGRLLVRGDTGYPQAALRWGEPEALQWAWAEVPATAPQASGWRLQAGMARPGLLLCANEPPLYLDTEAGVLGPVVAEGLAPETLHALLKAPVVPEAALHKHADLLAQRLMAVPLPPGLPSVAQIAGVPPQPCLHLRRVPAAEIHLQGLVVGQVLFDYAGHRGFWTPMESKVLLSGGDNGQRLRLLRDLAAEHQALKRLQVLGLWTSERGEVRLGTNEPPLLWVQWADSGWATLREAGFEVSVDDDMRDWVMHADNVQLGMSAVGGERAEDAGTSPWFELSLGMEVNGQRHNVLPWLPEILAMAASCPLDAHTGLPQLPDFLYLRTSGDTGFVRVPSHALHAWLGALLELVGERTLDFSGNSVRLSRLEALRTSAALGEGVVWAGAQHLRDLVARMKGTQSLPAVPLPSGVMATLRPYQQHGLNWLQFLRENALAGILADDMGLGKTLQTLAHIQVEKDAGRLDRPALIIAPVSLLANWFNEAKRFCPGLRCLVLHGQERHEKAHTLAEHDVVIAPYSLLQRDRENWLQAQWHLVVLDEAHNIKNASTHAAQVACELDTRHRLCLSGTPMENHLGEIWSLFHFLMPGFLGSQQRFKQLFRTPIERQGDPQRLAQLRARITPFMLRRTKALVANELPPKVESMARVVLSGKQADLYETIRLSMEKTVREALATKGLAKSQITILDALLKLRQACCDPRLLKLDAAKTVKNSAKLDHLMELLPEMLAEGRRVLLFSQFTSMLNLIETELKKRDLCWVKLTGQSQNREQLIERFTSGEVPLFLISLKAGGVGLNLAQADTVIHYDPWWNPAVENQATDRAHRIGQTQSVWVLKLVAQGTIEERILALQERKAALADGVYSGSTARREPLFGEGDLAELLKPLGAV
ncbi:SNF2-related protein [Hydrogenophaga atypica]